MNFSVPRWSNPICGSTRSTTSPSSSSTRRSTPCAAGCCGPKLMAKLRMLCSAIGALDLRGQKRVEGRCGGPHGPRGGVTKLSVDPSEGRQRLPDDLVHVVVAVGRQPPHEPHVPLGEGQTLVTLEQGLVLGSRDRVVR